MSDSIPLPPLYSQDPRVEDFMMSCATSGFDDGCPEASLMPSGIILWAAACKFGVAARDLRITVH
jgi:hypothetical protein